MKNKINEILAVVLITTLLVLMFPFILILTLVCFIVDDKEHDSEGDHYEYREQRGRDNY